MWALACTLAFFSLIFFLLSGYKDIIYKLPHFKPIKAHTIITKNMKHILFELELLNLHLSSTTINLRLLLIIISSAMFLFITWLFILFIYNTISISSLFCCIYTLYQHLHRLWGLTTTRELCILHYSTYHFQDTSRLLSSKSYESTSSALLLLVMLKSSFLAARLSKKYR